MSTPTQIILGLALSTPFLLIIVRRMDVWLCGWLFSVLWTNNFGYLIYLHFRIILIWRSMQNFIIIFSNLWLTARTRNNNNHARRTLQVQVPINTRNESVFFLVWFRTQENGPHPARKKRANLGQLVTPNKILDMTAMTVTIPLINAIRLVVIST